MKNSAKYFHLKFIKKEKLSRDVFAFYFDRVKRGSAEQLDFLAGQYVHLYLPVANEKGRGNSRMFTIASSPLEKDYIFIATKKGRTIYKKTLFNLARGTPTKFYGLSGSLIIDDPPVGGKKPQYVFLALGIGITPFRSILKYISQKKLKISVTLIASNSSKEKMCFHKELLEISKSNPNIKIVYTLNRIDGELIKKYIKNTSSYLYFIAGSPSGVLDLEDVVSGMGVRSDRIFIEDFEGY